MNILEKLFFDCRLHNMSLEEIEKEIYENQDIENLMKNDDYIDLISLDFESKFIYNEIERILSKYVEEYKYYKYKITEMTDIAINKFERTASVLMEFYFMYCHGCEFLRTLGLDYGLTCVVPPNANDWYDLTEEQQNELINSFYPQIIETLKELKFWIDSELITVSKYDDSKLKYIYVDKREMQ